MTKYNHDNLPNPDEIAFPPDARDRFYDHDHLGDPVFLKDIPDDFDPNGFAIKYLREHPELLPDQDIDG